MTKFVARNGERYRVLLVENDGMWLISYEQPGSPFFTTESGFEKMPAPEEFCTVNSKRLTVAQQERLELIQPLLDEQPRPIIDHDYRLALAKGIAAEKGTTHKRVLRLFYRYLAQGILTAGKRRASAESNPDFDWAIKTFYYSAKKFSLRAAYEMMLVQRFSDVSGSLFAETPTWSSFRHYFYNRGYHKQPQKIIARDGLTYYQRNCKPVFGSAGQWKSAPGAFQMDATQGDIYLVSRLDRSSVIGRPNIYLAVDTATQLITGFYVGLGSDETAVMKCLENAATSKVEYCRQFGIEITAEQWPNTGLPNEIITDKGREFLGPRMDELCRRYGIEVESLPPFRPDRKGLVEKSFDLLQQRYKPLLRGKGIIEADAQERWAVDYRSQAVLDLDEFTAILIHCILYLNSGRALPNGQTPAQEWLAANPKLLEVPAEELHCMTLLRVKAKFTRKGFKVNGLWYAPEDTDGLFIGDSYLVAYDPADIQAVSVVMENGYLLCWLTDSAFEERLSVAETKQAQEKQRSAKRAADQRAQQAGVSAAKNIEGIVKRAQERCSDGISKKQDGGAIKKNRTVERGRLT